MLGVILETMMMMKRARKKKTNGGEEEAFVGVEMQRPSSLSSLDSLDYTGVAAFEDGELV